MNIAHPQTQSEDPRMTNLLTFFLISAGLCFHQLIGPSGLYDLFFKVVSCLPVLMAVVINYPKFSARVKSMYKSVKPKRKRTK